MSASESEAEREDRLAAVRRRIERRRSITVDDAQDVFDANAKALIDLSRMLTSLLAEPLDAWLAQRERARTKR
jgi:hypothetical protein